MLSGRYHGFIRFHFFVKAGLTIILFWVLFALFRIFGASANDLVPSNLWLAFVGSLSLYVEKRLRPRGLKSLGGLTSSARAEVIQRELIFSLLGFLIIVVLGKAGALPLKFLGCYFVLFSAWIIWVNTYGVALMQRVLYRSRSKGRAQTLVLASEDVIEADAARSLKHLIPGADYLGYVSFGDYSSKSLSDQVLGDFSSLAGLCSKHEAKVLMTLGIEDRPQLVKSLQKMCDAKGMRLIWVDDMRKKFGAGMDIHRHGNCVLYTNWSEPLEEPFNRAVKRVFDLFVSLGVVLFVLPWLCALVIILHRRYSPGPLLFRQQRTGRNGEIINVMKFRSMHLNDCPGKQVSDADDPRIFKGGGFLRRSSLDEMPQFLNVLLGEMSVVGPRPHFVDHDRQFEDVVDDYRVRHFAKPGITGLAQVKGCRGETDTDLKVHQRVRFDNFYLRRWSLLLDLLIVCLTALQVVSPPSTAR